MRKKEERVRQAHSWEIAMEKHRGKKSSLWCAFSVTPVPEKETTMNPGWNTALLRESKRLLSPYHHCKSMLVVTPTRSFKWKEEPNKSQVRGRHCYFKGHPVNFAYSCKVSATQIEPVTCMSLLCSWFCSLLMILSHFKQLHIFLNKKS